MEALTAAVQSVTKLRGEVKLVAPGTLPKISSLNTAGQPMPQVSLPRLREVVLQNPRKGHFGGLVAAPVFHNVMSFALQTLKIPPTGTKPPRAKLTW